MPYKTRIPPVKLILTKNDFNFFIEILDSEITKNNENLSEKADKIKNKVLKFSVPVMEDEKEYVDVRFFINEITDLFYILFDLIEKNNFVDDTDYYQVLMKIRNQIINKE